MFCIYARCGKEVPDGSAYCPWCGRKQTHETKKKHRRANGAGSVYKVGGKRRKPWIALKDGKSIGRYFTTEREAIEALLELEDVQDVDLYNQTVAGFYEIWSATAYENCKASFKNDYTNAWKHVPQKLRTRHFREVKTADLQAVIDAIYNQGRSESVQLKVKSLFSFLCAYAMSNDIINKNYADFLKVHKTERRKDASVFTADELDLIIEKAKGDAENREVQTARIIMIYLFTGMRLSELLPLKCSAIHLDEKFPYLIGGEKTEAGIDRVIPIIKEIRPYVHWFLDHSDGDGLFDAYKGNTNPNNWRSRDYYPLLDELGVARHTPHGTRRTTATLAVEARVAPDALQKIGGWKEFQTIQKHYNKPNVEYLYTEMEKIGEATEKRRSQKTSGEGDRVGTA